MSDAAELYQAVIDDHRRRPRNRGPLPAANRVAKRENPACGDLCAIQLRLEPASGSDARIAAAAFTGAGCALSQASASLATTALAGLSAPEARALAATVEQLVRTGAIPPSSSDGPPPVTGEIAALAAAHAFPARHACALLAWQAALAALDSA